MCATPELCTTQSLISNQVKWFPCSSECRSIRYTWRGMPTRIIIMNAKVLKIFNYINVCHLLSLLHVFRTCYQIYHYDVWAHLFSLFSLSFLVMCIHCFRWLGCWISIYCLIESHVSENRFHAIWYHDGCCVLVLRDYNLELCT
jgi:hypothetical protein